MHITCILMPYPLFIIKYISQDTNANNHNELLRYYHISKDSLVFQCALAVCMIYFI